MNAGGMPPAAVLAGGLGTRIRAVAGDRPKVLLPVEGRPFLAHVLDYLAGEGVKRVVLCLGHQADRVARAAQESAPRSLELVESREEKPLGTGGALRNALPLLGDEFFVVNGDTYLDTPLADLLAFHREREARLTLSLVRWDRAAEKGTVRTNREGFVTAFEEKTKQGSGLINAGVYVGSPAVVTLCPPGEACSLERDAIPRALELGMRIAARVTDASFVDIGLPEDYERIRDRLPRSGGKQ